MTSQQQDLVFFDDNSLVSSRLLTSGLSTLHIISHDQETSPSWLVSAIVENALVGTASLVNRDLTTKSHNRSLVVYISFTHPEDFIARNCRKQEIDLTLANFTFVDCFTNLFTEQITTPANAKAHVEKMFAKICKAIEDLKNLHRTVIIESPELLLAATDLQSNDLLILMRRITRLCNVLFVVVDTQSPLIDMESSAPEDPVFKITDFYVKLHHMSSMNISILPLSTGRAKDITGSLTVGRGAIPPDSLLVVENEYVYNITKESSVKLFFR